MVVLEKLAAEICMGHIINQDPECPKCPWNSTKASCLIHKYIPGNTSYLLSSGILGYVGKKNGKYNGCI